MPTKRGKPAAPQWASKAIEELKHDNSRLIQQAADLATECDMLRKRNAVLTASNSELRGIITKVAKELVPYTTQRV